MSPRSSVLLVAAAALLVAACGEEKVATYRVPKEKESAVAMAAPGDAGPPGAVPAGGGSMADTPVPTAGGAALVWKAPSPWTEKAASGVRKGSFTVAGASGEADLSVTAFPGDVGGELANVNRWRGQLALPPLQAQELDGSVSRVQANGLTFTLVQLASPGDANAKAILGAIVPVDGSTWFFKLTGPGGTVREAKPAFLEFLHTVKAP